MPDIEIHAESFKPHEPSTIEWLWEFYDSQIREIIQYLKNGVNVLIKGDVEVSRPFTEVFTDVFKEQQHEILQDTPDIVPPYKLPPNELARGISSYCQNYLSIQWNSAPTNEKKKKLVLMRSLETLTTMLNGDLQNMPYELVFLLNDLQDRCVFLGISDPSGPILPPTLRNLFPKTVILKGVTGPNVAGLLTLEEAKLLGTEKVLTVEDQNKLADSAKGLNPLAFRRLLTDALKRHGNDRTKVFEHMKKMTMTAAQMELVERSVKVCGYHRLIGEGSDLKTFFIDPYRRWAETHDEKLKREMFKSILLYGIPGTGKTLIAKWIAHQLNMRIRIVAPYDIKGSLLGQSELNVRRIFEDARRFAPCILVFDEMDDLFKERESRDVGSGIRSTLLSEMAGLGEQAMVFVIGTTNNREAIDKAFLRTSRLSLQIEVPPPLEDDRREILDYYAKNLGLDGLGWDDNITEDIARIDGFRLDSSISDSFKLEVVGDHLYGLCRRILLRHKTVDPDELKLELEKIVRMAYKEQ